MRTIRTGLRWIGRVIEFAVMFCLAGFLCSALLLNIVSIPGLP